MPPQSESLTVRRSHATPKRRGRPPAQVTALGRWCVAFDVSSEKLAQLCGVHLETAREWRRGTQVPSDAAKAKIAEVTTAIEIERGRKRPRGIRILDWYSEAA